MRSTLHILYLEDDPNDVELVRSALVDGGIDCKIVHVTTFHAYIAALKGDSFHLILADHSPPDYDAFSALRTAKRECPEVPFIIVSTTSEEEAVIEGMKSGADNYILKQHMSRLVPAVTRALREAQEKRKPQSAETLLQTGEKRFRTLFESAGDAVFTIEGERFVDCNHKTLELFGCTHEQIIGREPYSLSPERQPDGTASKEKALAKIRLALSGTPQFFEWRHCRHDGTPFDTEVSLSAFDAPGSRRLIAVVRDITERKQADKNQRLAVRVMQRLNQPSTHLDAIEDILRIVREDTGFDAAAIRLREGDDFPYFMVSGFSEEFVQAERYLCARDDNGEIIRDSAGDPYLECMCGNILCGRTDPLLPFFTETGSFWTNSTTDLLASTSEEQRQARTRNRCAGEGYESVALIPLRSEGETIGLLQLNDRRRNGFTPEMIRFFEGLGESIGVALKRKKMGDALKESEGELRIRNRIAQVFLTRQDDETYAEVLRIVLDSARSRYGIFGSINEKEELVCASLTGETWEKCRIPDKDVVFPQDTWGGIWGRSLKEKEVFFSNLPLSVPEGHITITRALSVPIIHHGEAIGIFLAANKPEDYEEKDIRLLQTVADSIGPVLHARLQRDRHEREKILLEKQLRLAKKMEAVGTLAGGVAHDFNNILAIIMGYAELALHDSGENRQLSANMQQILNASLRARDVVNQILTFSRREDLERRLVDILPVLREALQFIRASLPSSIDIREEIEVKSAWVFGDSSQIYQIVINLCVNAAHAMRGENGTLEIGLTEVCLNNAAAALYQDLRPGPFLKLSVRDTGHGMDPSVMERIFDPFFTTKKQGEGTGMGLSLVHGIVKNHEGAIFVDSKIGEGSTFHVFLPKSIGIQSQKPMERLDEAKGEGRILFVDDEPAVIDLGQQILEDFGYEVVARTSSIEALEAFRAQSNKFDMVISDITMPNMMGPELAGELKKIRPDIPIILCSGFSEGLDPAQARSIGIRDILRKPVPMKDLITAVRNILNPKAEKDA